MKLLTDYTGKEKAAKIRTRRQMLATGFASPADAFVEKRLDINDYVVQNPTSTFYFKLTTEFQKHSPLQKRDILVVDRSLTPLANHFAIATVEGEFIPIQLVKRNHQFIAKDLRKNEDLNQDYSIWGMITHIIRPVP